ncbi:MAG TPA: trypsin-like peptidase domain-containing protein [Bacteroidota bacterium]|nr:trypsin-like peptidase domain-containing protein [Bacteroidota bacterium]
MNNPYIRFFVILIIPLLIGGGVGYAIKSTGVKSANAAEPIFEKTFPQAVTVQEKPAAQTDDVTSSRKNAITQAVAKVSPAVVGINVTAVQQVRYNDPFAQYFNDPFFQQFFGNRTYKQEVKELGSGFIISPDGYIVTNDHVAGNATEITVTLSGGKQMKAKLVGTDAATDICLLKVDGTNLPFVSLGNSDNVMIGEWAIALGNPFGLFEINDKPTVTVGVISSTGMKLGQIENRYYRDMIETDAAINGGNSGGPLVNSDGDVIGMNTLIYTNGQTNTYIGYGFAIPVNKVKKVVAQLKNKGKVARSLTAGFDWQVVDGRIAKYLGMKQPEGIIVSEVAAKGPAEKSGLRVGDVIMKVNGEKIKSGEDVLAMMVDMTAGDMLNLTVYRERKNLDIQLVLERAPGETNE